MSVKMHKLREKRNRPPADQPWTWLTRELLESDAWRTAPRETLQFIFRLMLEHQAHAGTDNGRLVCTFDDCQAYGLLRKRIKAAQVDAIRRGLVYQSQNGVPAKGRGRQPSRFGLGWLPGHDASPAPHRWKAWHPPLLDIKGSTHGGNLNRGWKSAGNGAVSRIKVPTGDTNKVPHVGTEKKSSRLPPGWKWGKFRSGHVRVLCPNPSNENSWVEVPLIHGVGDELEQAALEQLDAWKQTATDD